MKLFLDSANLKEIRDAVSWGAIDGVTTNPSLVAKEQREFFPLLKEICEAVNGPVSMETTSPDSAGMVAEGRRFAALHQHIVVKCPLNKEGLKATRQLSGEKIHVNVTLCFSPNQALLAAKAGACLISPFIGRLDDISQDGMELIRDIKIIYANYRFTTQILVASIRNPLHVIQAAKIGADVATLPFAVLESLVKHPLTDIGLEKFMKDWERLPEAAKKEWTGGSGNAASLAPSPAAALRRSAQPPKA